MKLVTVLLTWCDSTKGQRDKKRRGGGEGRRERGDDRGEMIEVNHPTEIKDLGRGMKKPRVD